MKKYFSLIVAPILLSMVLLLMGFSAEAHELAADFKSQLKVAASIDMTVTNHILSDARQMTFVGPRSGEGYFSHDGKYLIFQSEREKENPFYQIYIMNRQNGQSVRVSPGAGKTTCAWIHP